MTYTGAKTTVSIQSNIFGGEIKTFLIPFSISNRKIHTYAFWKMWKQSKIGFKLLLVPGMFRRYHISELLALYVF